jgi:small subunit ribosomal protein S2
MVDTNSNPKFVDFPIPANDDATKSISIILDAICDAIKLGLEDRKNTKDKGADKTEVAEEVAVAAAPEVTEAKEETKED